MATSRLKLYNGALLICAQRSVASLTVNEEARRLLDEVWDDGGVKYCLEQAQWKFAMRTSKFDYDTTITPDFGYVRAFAKPSDWVLTSALCSDEYFKSPVTEYADEAGYWFADLNEIYVRYVSDHDNFGNDLSRWPASFTEYVKSYFAWRIIHKLPGGSLEKISEVEKTSKRQLLFAKNRDAMAGPAQFPARGFWLNSRLGRGSFNRDRGTRHGNLIG